MKHAGTEEKVSTVAELTGKPILNQEGQK